MDNSYKLEHAWNFIERGQLLNGIELIKTLLSTDPNNAMGHGILAYALLKQMRLHAAEYELKIALQLAPNEPFFHSVSARILFLQNKPKAALAACDQALQLNPQYANIHELKANILMANKRTPEAFKCINSMAALEPNSANTACTFAEYYHATGDNKKAMAYTLDALKINAQHQDANILMGRLLLLKGEMPEALYHARLCIMMDPNSATALGLLADVKSRQNIFLAPWWKFNAKLSQMSRLAQVGVLIFGYVFFGLLANIIKDSGHPNIGIAISFFWLGIAIYSWVALPLYQRMVAKEIQQFSFRADY
ncbi:MAG: hypothetical protein RL497_621 [Pseudomonadota bacterium]|jgi:tetratricopeptide (TPR) repeat protein